MPKKNKIYITCPKCKKKIFGSSERHAKMNLMIHEKASTKCKEIQERINNILKEKNLIITF